MAKKRTRQYFDPPPLGAASGPAPTRQQPSPDQAVERGPADPAPPAARPVEVPGDASIAAPLRASQRELAEVRGQLAREREELERVRGILASQRLTMAALNGQLDRRRAELSAERDRLESAVAQLTERGTAMERDLGERRRRLESELSARQADLTDRVEQLDRRRAELDSQVARRAAELAEQTRRLDAELATAQAEAGRLTESAASQAEAAIRQAEQQAARLTTEAQAEAGRLRSAAERESAQMRSAAEASISANRQAAGIEIEQIRQKAQAEAAALEASATRQAEQLLEAAREAGQRASQEGAAVLDAARAEADRTRQAAEADASAVRQSVQQELAELRQSAEASASAVLDAAGREAEATTGRVRRQADEMLRAADEEACRLRRSAEAAIAEKQANVEAELEQRRQAVEAEVAARMAAVASAEQDQADRTGAATAAIQRAEQELAEKQAAFERETAAQRQRIASIDADLARLESGKAELAEQRGRLDRANSDLTRRLRDLGVRESRIEAAEIELTHRKAQAEAEAVHRLAQAESAAAALADLEQSLSRQRAELERGRAALAEAEQAGRATQAELDRAQEALQSRQQAVESAEQSLRQRQEELEQARWAQEADGRQLQQQGEALVRERAEAESLARQLAARGEQLQETERQVLAGWEEVRRARTDLVARPITSKSQAPAGESAGEPAGGAIRAASRFGINARAYRRWGLVLAVCTALALLVAETTLWMASKPVYRAAGQLRFDVADAVGGSAGKLAMAEFVNFVKEARPGEPTEQTGESLIGPTWRARLILADRGSDTAVMLVDGEDDSANGALALVNQLMNGYHHWREGKLDALRGGAPLTELYRRHRLSQTELDVQRRAERSTRDEVISRAGLDRSAGDAPPRQVLALLDDGLGQVKSALEAASGELEQLSIQRLSWRTELDALRAAQPTDGPPEADPIERALELDRQQVAATRAELDEIAAKAADQLATARAEWLAAAEALVDLLGARDTRTSDPAVAAASRRLDASRIAFDRASADADPLTNPRLRALNDRIADLTERIAANQRQLGDRAAQIERAGRIDKLRALLSASQERFEQLQQRVEQQRARQLELIAERRVYGDRVEAVERAEQELFDVQRQLNRAQGLAAARISLSIEPPSIVASSNPRAGWMLLAAAIILALSAGAGWLALVLISRPAAATGPQSADATVRSPSESAGNSAAGGPPSGRAGASAD